MAFVFVVAYVALVNPGEYSTLRHISICAGNVQVQQDPRFATLLPAQAQQLPLDYVSQWPIYVTKPKSSRGTVPVHRVPMPEQGVDLWSTWCAPAAFEQLWLPEDLPPPKVHAAIALVLRNGEPRYIFPTVDAFIETEDGTVWRNRGLHSVPLAKTWLHLGEVPVDELRLSAWFLPPPVEAVERAQSEQVVQAPSSDDVGDSAIIGDYERLLPSTAVAEAVDTAFDALDTLPPLMRKTSLGNGFCYLIAPLSAEQPLHLPERAIAPGGRLRAFLSPEGSDDDDECWQRGELDLTMWRLPPGRDSPYMQDKYRPLYLQT